MATHHVEDRATNVRGPSVIVNVIEVLRCFTVQKPLLGVTELADQVHLHKSSVSRILATLEQENLVERDARTRKFRLGLGLIAVAGPLLANLDVRRVAFPILQDLCERTRETTVLTLWDGAGVVCVEEIPSAQPVRHSSAIGTRYGSALSASVQVFLAAESKERVLGLLNSGKIDLASRDPDSLEHYLDRLAAVRKQSYATNYGETCIQEFGVAAPVLDHRGSVVAALMLAAPCFRISSCHIRLLGEACRDAADQVTLRLGGQAGAR